MGHPSTLGSGNRRDIVSKLKQFYTERGIAVGAFDCPYRQQCCASVGDASLTKGAEAHIGDWYGNPFKLVVVSADRGDGQSETLERRTETIQSLTTLNRHMSGTLEMLRALLGEPRGGTSLFKRFAMTNAVKCTTALRRRMPDAMFLNCAQFAIGEVAVLCPDLVVLQGAGPKLSLRANLSPIPVAIRAQLVQPYRSCPDEVIRFIDGVIDDHFRLLQAHGCRSMALLTPHPSDRQGRWKAFSKRCLGFVATMVRRLLTREASVD